MKLLLAMLTALAVLTGSALADAGKDNPSDGNAGGGNQPHAPGQTTNPNPGK